MSRRDQRQRQRILRRRAIFVAGVLVLMAATVAIFSLRHQISTEDAAVASPVASTDPGIGELPPSRIIASAGPVELNLPVDRKFAEFTLFRPIDNPGGVAITPDESWKHTIWDEQGVGPQTAGLDIATPAGTIVFAPVTGQISGVQDYVVAGRTVGYQLDISPEAASDVVVRIRSITSIPIEDDVSAVCRQNGVLRPDVGTVVTAGVTCLGQVIDVAQELGDVAPPMIARYTSDGGNHVHLEVVRVNS